MPPAALISDAQPRLLDLPRQRVRKGSERVAIRQIVIRKERSDVAIECRPRCPSCLDRFVRDDGFA
jgi:hypothetical protein